MDKKTEEELNRLLTQARMRLLNDHPFFGDLVFGLPVYWDDKINPPTAQTNGAWAKFHPDFFRSMSLEERMFVLAHEVMHCVLLHCSRIKGRDEHKWKVAIDLVVNQLLVNGGVGKMLAGGAFDPHLYYKGCGVTEKIYDLLTDEYCDQYNTGSGREGFDVHIELSDEEVENEKTKWRTKLQEAADTAKRRGTLSADVEAFVESMGVEEVSWKDHIAEAVYSPKGQDRTWTKQNRRFASSDINLPGKYGDEAGPIVLALDCSGSTSDKMVADVGHHLAHIQEQMRPEKIHVLYFDSDIKKHEEFGPDDPIQVKVYGRGGTAFSPIFKYIEDNNIDPTCCIVCTDLYCDDYGPEPDYPVLWCVMESEARNAPWGKVLVID